VTALDETPEGFRSGFVTFVGRPNAGKSTLLNHILGIKVSIVSDKPQTTRNQIRGIFDRPDAQVVFVDTPGIHKPRSSFNERLNEAATQATTQVDVVCLVIDAAAPIGRGDEFIAETLGPDTVVVLTKADKAKPDKMIVQLARAAEWDFSEYYPVSGVTGAGVPELLEGLIARLPEGPRLYDADTVTDQPDAFWVAELVREQLLKITREELPHSIATRVTEWEWPYIRIEILVERESQKGIVIGKKGAVLKQVGEAVREQLREGAYVDLHVKVAKDWQDRPERLGYGATPDL
jgi:GTP-binding protein Era